MRASRLLWVERVAGGAAAFASASAASSSRTSFAGASGGRAASAEEAARARGAEKEKRRWSFAMQDTPATFQKYLDDVDKGYAVRVGLFLGVVCTVGYACYQYFVYRQRHLPLAKRWGMLSPTIPITLLERREIEGKMHLYRFALPTPADYAGYEPVSSVRVHSGFVRDFDSISRWFTPVSHPSERGIIEFAIKDADPGRMASRLHHLTTGDVLYLGRWMKEFPYTANKYTDIGVICTVGGSSVALQLMKVMTANENDTTRLSILYCAQSAASLPFEDLFVEMSKKHPNTLKIAFNVLTRNGRKSAVANGELPMHLGLLDHTTLMKSLPPPPVPDSATGVAPDASKTKILICAPVSLMAPVAGRPTPIGNFTYYQGGFYKYGGLLKEMGYQRSQVYKFGVSTHVLAHHY
jgi:NAD(P)H-flavin reductase